jgi:hypothetical protein
MRGISPTARRAPLSAAPSCCFRSARRPPRRVACVPSAATVGARRGRRTVATSRFTATPTDLLSSGCTRWMDRQRVASAPPSSSRKLWVGDEPVWSPDAREVFVPLAPSQEPTDTATRESTFDASAAAKKTDGVTVTIFRAGREVQDARKDAATAPLVNHFMRENNATLAAIDVVAGRMRVVVPADASPSPSVLRLSRSGRWLS